MEMVVSCVVLFFDTVDVDVCFLPCGTGCTSLICPNLPSNSRVDVNETNPVPALSGGSQKQKTLLKNNYQQ